jgi:DNA-binding NtrC family response regulator
VTKPIDVDILEAALNRAVSHRTLQEKVKRLKGAAARAQRFDDLIGDSPPMKALFSQIVRVAETGISVLITGESGAGKELIARTLHRHSKRSDAPFIPVNCSALPEPLLESELFGHKRGAFTDAKTDRKGLFQKAEKGTLFLDEIGELPMMLQPKLLRAIEERCIRPVGSDAEIAVDVRILAATNIDLESAVEAGQFREDLFYRLNVMQMAAPPLRSRGADILALAEHFIQHFADRFDKRVTGVSENAAQKLLDYSWPGNVRELRNAMERAVALTRFENIAVDDLPPKIQAYRTDHFFIGGHDPSRAVAHGQSRTPLHPPRAESGRGQPDDGRADIETRPENPLPETPALRRSRFVTRPDVRSLSSSWKFRSNPPQTLKPLSAVNVDGGSPQVCHDVR